MEGKKDEVSIEGKVSPFIVYLLLLFEVLTQKHIHVLMGSKEGER